MQVDRMFSAEAEITKKQNKKMERGTSIQGKGGPARLIMAQRQGLVNILLKAVL